MGRRLLFSFAFVASLHLPAQAQIQSGPLRLDPGARVVFLGDSITHMGHYVAAFESALWSLMPEKDLTFFNAGVSGDVAADALERLDAEVIAQKPDVVTILLGMNDARYRALDSDLLDTYRRDMTHIVQRLTGETQAQVVLLAPSYFDEVSIPEGRQAPPAYNDTLIRYGTVCRSLAEQFECHFVDLNRPLLEASAALRAQDESVSLVPDAIHPNAAGGLVMAHALLKGLVDPSFSRGLTLPTPEQAEQQARVQLSLRAVPPAWDTQTCSGIAEFLKWPETWNPYYLDASHLPAGRWKVWLGESPALEVEGGVRGPAVPLANLPAALLERASTVQGLFDRRRRIVGTEVRDEVWRIKGSGTAASRQQRYASIHSESLKLAWVKIAVLDKQLVQALREPLLVACRVERCKD